MVWSFAVSQVASRRGHPVVPFVLRVSVVVQPVLVILVLDGFLGVLESHGVEFAVGQVARRRCYQVVLLY
jgi:hypothetical protein